VTLKITVDDAFFCLFHALPF